jgi:hypothetical protein
MHELKHKEIIMRHLSTGLAVISPLFASAPCALADIEELLDVDFVMKRDKIYKQ